MNLSVPLTSGAIFSASDAYFSNGSIQGFNIQNGLQQAVATGVSPVVYQKANSFGISLPLDQEYSEPLITAGLYYLIGRILGHPAPSGSSLLLSAGSSYAAKKGLEMMGKNDSSSASQVIGNVTPNLSNASRVIG